MNKIAPATLASILAVASITGNADELHPGELANTRQAILLHHGGSPEQTIEYHLKYMERADTDRYVCAIYPSCTYSVDEFYSGELGLCYRLPALGSEEPPERIEEPEIFGACTYLIVHPDASTVIRTKRCYVYPLQDTRTDAIIIEAPIDSTREQQYNIPCTLPKFSGYACIVDPYEVDPAGRTELTGNCVRFQDDGTPSTGAFLFDTCVDVNKAYDVEGHKFFL